MVNNIGEKTASKVSNLYKVDETAQAFFDWAASRINDATETSIDRIAYMSDISRSQAIELGKQLEEIGCGSFVVGRRGARTRMKWHYSLRSLGLVAQGTTSELEEIDHELADDSADGHDASEDSLEQPTGGGIRHKYTLRPNSSVVFTLPEDLTRREAERLATFIQSLPFDN